MIMGLFKNLSFIKLIGVQFGDIQHKYPHRIIFLLDQFTHLNWQKKEPIKYKIIKLLQQTVDKNQNK